MNHKTFLNSALINCSWEINKRTKELSFCDYIVLLSCNNRSCQIDWPAVENWMGKSGKVMHWFQIGSYLNISIRSRAFFRATLPHDIYVLTHCSLRQFTWIGCFTLLISSFFLTFQIVRINQSFVLVNLELVKQKIRKKLYSIWHMLLHRNQKDRDRWVIIPNQFYDSIKKKEKKVECVKLIILKVNKLINCPLLRSF